MPQQLTDLSVQEVSLVDAPANPGARVLLFKRGDAPAPAEIEAYLKRQFSEDDRKRLAASGAALPDGSFPIENKADLSNAIHAYGRAKDKPKAKAHIIARAKTLGASDLIPQGWQKRGVIAKALAALGFAKEAMDFDEAQAAIETGEYAQGLLCEFDEALDNLRQSIWSIIGDDQASDKQALIDETINQYREHVKGVVPEAMEKAMRGAALAAAGLTIDPQGGISKGDGHMTDDEKTAAAKAAKDAAEHADTKKALEIANREISVLKMSDKHKSYMADKGMSEDQRAAFADKSPDDRDAHIEKNPVEKSAATVEIEKANKAAADALALVQKMQDERALDDVTKRVTAFGAPADVAKHLHAIGKAAPDAAKALEQTIKGLAEQVRTGKVFAEFGTSNGADATSPTAQMMAKVAELRKADPKLRSDAAAIAKVAADPAQRDLWNAYKAATSGTAQAA